MKGEEHTWIVYPKRKYTCNTNREVKTKNDEIHLGE